MPKSSSKRLLPLLILLVSLALGILFDYFFWGKVPGISVPLYASLIIIALLSLATYLKKEIPLNAIFVLTPLGFFSLMVFVRTSPFLTFLNIIISLFLLLLIAGSNSKKPIRDYFLSDYLKACFALPFKLVIKISDFLADLIISGKNLKQKNRWTAIVRGIFISIPILLIFILLFYSADLVFQKYISNLIHFDIEFETVFRLFLILFLTLLFGSAYRYRLVSNETEKPIAAKTSPKTLGKIESSILLGSVNALFLVFIIIQLTYLFGGESNISLQGFTYSAYARKGFGELMVVAIISFLLIWITEKHVARLNQKHSPLFRIFSGALILQVIVVLISAFTRLTLYENAYGFTTARLYGYFLLIWLGLIFVLLLYKIFVDQKETTFTRLAFISTLGFLAFINFLNPDAFIAQQNIARYHQTEKLDVYYLSNLSTDALPVNLQILDLPDEELSKSFAHKLYWDLDRLDSEYYQEEYKQWQSFNLSRIQGENLLRSKRQVLEENKDYASPEVNKLYPITPTTEQQGD